MDLCRLQDCCGQSAADRKSWRSGVNRNSAGDLARCGACEAGAQIRIVVRGLVGRTQMLGQKRLMAKIGHDHVGVARADFWSRDQIAKGRSLKLQSA